MRRKRRIAESKRKQEVVVQELPQGKHHETADMPAHDSPGTPKTKSALTWPSQTEASQDEILQNSPQQNRDTGLETQVEKEGKMQEMP